VRGGVRAASCVGAVGRGYYTNTAATHGLKANTMSN
jgi:hypothetical protein